MKIHKTSNALNGFFFVINAITSANWCLGLMTKKRNAEKILDAIFDRFYYLIIDNLFNRINIICLVLVGHLRVAAMLA